VPVESASLAVRASSGKRLLLSQVLRSGRALQYTSPTCYPD
jgi:hypothetical protein